MQVKEAKIEKKNFNIYRMRHKNSFNEERISMIRYIINSRIPKWDSLILKQFKY